MVGFCEKEAAYAHCWRRCLSSVEEGLVLVERVLVFSGPNKQQIEIETGYV